MRKKILFAAGLLCVLLLPNIILAQNKTITGKVSDAKGYPVPGASVVVFRGNLGTVTDGEGKFKLTTPANATLVISSAGLQSQTIKTDATVTQLQINMIEDITKLDEVVITGLSTSVKRRNLANAVATISSKELNGIAPPQTFDAALEGKIPGAYINSNTGAPGGGMSVRLRGVTSVYGNSQPLYILDGVFVDNTATSAGLNFVTNAAPASGLTSTQDNPSSRIADLRPEDVENIEILKGASAAAIYGSKAAAGVIIITTKRGKQGRTRVSVSQDLGFIKARKLIGVRTFTPERAASLGGNDSVLAANLSQQFITAQSKGEIYDYEKEIYGNTGFARNTVVSVSGANERTDFYLSAAQKDETGIVKNTGYRNSSLRLNIGHQINENIKIGASANYINSSSDRGLTGNDNAGVTYGIALAFTPSFAQLHPDAEGVYPNNPFASSNPLQTIALMRNNESVNRFLTGLNLEATLQKSTNSNTKFIARGGFDYYHLSTNALFPSQLQFQTVNKGTSLQGSTTNLNTNYIISLVNTLTPSDKLSLTTSAGMTQETGDFNNLLDVATQLISGQSNVNQAGALTATQFRAKFQNTGIFVQEEAGIAEAFTVTAGVRFDRSSNNGDPGKFYAYPKAGLSWNLTKMEFWNGDFFDNLKLRAAYGQANNVPAYGSKFTSMTVSNITGNPGSIVDIQQGEPGIKPERQTEFETGIDFSILKGKLGMSLTYYNKNIFDFLMLNNLPPSSGFTTQWLNAGDLRNRGVEIGLNAQPVSNRNIRWSTSVNFWLNRSMVTKLTIPPVPQGAFGLVIGAFQIEQGKSATQILGIGGPGGSIVQWGDQEPKFQMNTYNEITFFNQLSLRFLLHWKCGGDNINLTNLQSDFGQTSVDFDKVTNKLGIPDGYYRLSQVGVTAEQFTQDASYFRVREIGLYYSFTKVPQFIKGLRVGVSLNNYFTITKYKSYDPEVSNFGTGYSTGVDVDPYPATKRGDFHISVDF